MNRELLPILIVVGVLALIYLIMKMVNRKSRNRLRGNRFNKRRY